MLRWHLAHNRLIIPKSKTPDRIRENIDIFDFNLELTDIAQIDNLNVNERRVLSYRFAISVIIGLSSSP